MLNIESPVAWQVYDLDYPTLMPWYSHGMLKEVQKWDLKDKRVLEWGGGWSSIYWAFHCKEVVTIEADEDWCRNIREYADRYGLTNLTVHHRQVNEGDLRKEEFYTEVPLDYKPDIVCVDGVLRNSCLKKALTLPRPLTLIADNFNQSFVWVSPEALETMAPYEIHAFVQDNHTNNDGILKWQTVYWELT